MPQPSRREALATLREGHGAIQELIARLTDEELSRPRTIGSGGDWSAKDLVGHLASWEAFSLRSLEEWRRGERPWVEDVFADPEGVDRANEEEVRRRAPVPAADVLRDAEDTHGALVAAIETMDDEEWASRAPYPAQRRRTLASLLGSVMAAPKRPFGHAFAHLDDLRAYVASLR